MANAADSKSAVERLKGSSPFSGTEAFVSCPLTPGEPADERPYHGGATRSPQQVTLPSLCRPQVWLKPDATWVNVRDIGVTSGQLLLPQQAMDPSVRKAHAWSPPAEICVKAPVGGVVTPMLSSPQQTALPSARKAQVSTLPVPMSMNEPAGGVFSPKVL